MRNFMIHICTICGREKTRPGWFLIAENRWEDRLRILQWDDHVAWANGVHEACSVAHALELVVHWMRTNSLDYPFERTPPLSGSKQTMRKYDPDVSGARQLGELYVHRESIGRILDENPNLLTVILEELLLALQPGLEKEKTPKAEMENESEYAGSPS